MEGNLVRVDDVVVLRMTFQIVPQSDPKQKEVKRSEMEEETTSEPS